MLADWIHWLSSLHPDQLWLVLGGLLLIDTPRYAASQIVMCLWDCAQGCLALYGRRPVDEKARYCPSVCVVLAGYNESSTIDATLRSLWGTYPNLQIIVVDDGSSDGMAAIARNFASEHGGVLVFSRDRRNGKSSALNTAIPFTEAEIIVTVDTDSHLAPGALWEIVQPLRDPSVGAVSATVRTPQPIYQPGDLAAGVRVPADDFLRRMVVARLGLLGIVSGAFGAFRREALERVGGWDVGPGEDGDLTLRIRKVGYQIAFAPYAQCYSNVPTTWWRLFHQRRRWDRAVVTFECRKHVDMAYFWQSDFRWLEFFFLIERWFFGIICLYCLCGYTVWLLCGMTEEVPYVLFSLYLGYAGCELIASLTVLYYSNSVWRDLATIAIIPLVPFYQIFLKSASLMAVTEEIIFRQSYCDNFVPQHVREVTWHW